MKPLSPEASALIRAARGADDPDRHAHARVRRALAASAAAGVTSLAVASAEASLAAGLGVASAGAKPLLGVVLYLAIGGLAGGGVSVVMHQALEQPGPAASSPTMAVEASPEVAFESGLPAPASRAPAEPVNVASAAPAPSRPKEMSSSLEAEARRLGAAERALRQGQLTEARRQLDAYDRDFGQGVLRQEAEGARVVLACQSGDPAGAALAETFARRFPGSPLLPRVRGVCTDEAARSR